MASNEAQQSEWISAVRTGKRFSSYVVFGIFRSIPKSRPNNIYMGLKCPSVRTSVRQSTKKVFPIGV